MNKILIVSNIIRRNKILYRLYGKSITFVYFFFGLRVLSKALKSQKQPRPEPPKTVENFEDLSWLFFSNFLNRGIIKMDIDEAAYLFKIVRENKPSYLVEIGRDEGGSTMLLSTAKNKEAELVSLDLKDKCNALVKKMIDKNTSLTIADSRSFTPKQKIDFLFIDGDHSFEGVKADFENFLPYLNPNADVLFHDAVGADRGILVTPPVNTFVTQLEKNQGLKLVKDVGSTRHFKKV